MWGNENNPAYWRSGFCLFSASCCLNLPQKYNTNNKYPFSTKHSLKSTLFILYLFVCNLCHQLNYVCRNTLKARKKVDHKNYRHSEIEPSALTSSKSQHVIEVIYILCNLLFAQAKRLVSMRTNFNFNIVVWAGYSNYLSLGNRLSKTQICWMAWSI